MAKVKGYDGKAYTVGDRVEIHPGTDLWMMGARYGTVQSIVPTEAEAKRMDRHRVRVEMDIVRGVIPHNWRVRSGPSERFRAI